jgi:hypothetical protein
MELARVGSSARLRSCSFRHRGRPDAALPIAAGIGAASLVRPLSVRSGLLVREIPVLFLIMGIAIQSCKQPSRETDTLRRGMEDDGVPDSLPTVEAVPWFSVGIACLRTGSRPLVWGGVGMARARGVVSGLVVLALPGIIAPGTVDRAVIVRDLPIMVSVTLFLNPWVPVSPS